MQSQAATVAEYLAELPEDRRATVSALRTVIIENLDDGYEEGMQYGMIGYYVPHRVFPDGYHCDPKQPLPYMCLASQKNHLSVYSMALYFDPQLMDWFVDAWKGAGKKLDMGKSCIRFQRLDDVPLAVLAEVVRRTPSEWYIARYQQSLSAAGGASATRTRASRGKAAQESAPAARRTVASGKSGARAGKAGKTATGKLAAKGKAAAKRTTTAGAAKSTARGKTGAKKSAAKRRASGRR